MVTHNNFPKLEVELKMSDFRYESFPNLTKTIIDRANNDPYPLPWPTGRKSINLDNYICHWEAQDRAFLEILKHRHPGEAVKSTDGFGFPCGFVHRTTLYDSESEAAKTTLYVEFLLFRRFREKEAENFQTADSIRSQLESMGYVIEDTPDHQGTNWFVNIRKHFSNPEKGAGG